MLVLVVGGAGYIGSVFVRQLLDAGHRVRVLDRLYFGIEPLIEVRERIELFVADMCGELDPVIFKDVDAVVNLGGLSNDPTAEYNPVANTKMNTVATAELARQAKAHGVGRYIYASSCSVYYSDATDEASDVLLTEDTEVDPRAPYSYSKYNGEMALFNHTDESFCPVALRQGTVFGWSPRMRYDLVVNTFVRRALTVGRLDLHLGGEMWRPLVEVRDVGRAYLQCLQVEPDRIRGQVFNIAQGNYRISELALRVRAALARVGVHVDLCPDYNSMGIRSYRVSNEKAARVLGYRAAISVEQSVEDMVSHMGNPWLDDPIYYNIRWLETLGRAQDVLKVTGGVF